jgi:hypothetical protein
MIAAPPAKQQIVEGVEAAEKYSLTAARIRVFLGHYGVALAAKKAAPRTSLGSLVLAAQFVDLLWPFLLLAEVEHVRVGPGYYSCRPAGFL